MIKSPTLLPEIICIDPAIPQNIIHPGVSANAYLHRLDTGRCSSSHPHPSKMGASETVPGALVTTPDRLAAGSDAIECDHPYKKTAIHWLAHSVPFNPFSMHSAIARLNCGLHPLGTLSG